MNTALTRPAFNQLLALAPDESEYVRLYANHLKEQKRPGEARRVVETGLRLNPRSKRLNQLLEELSPNPDRTRSEPRRK